MSALEQHAISGQAGKVTPVPDIRFESKHEPESHLPPVRKISAKKTAASNLKTPSQDDLQTLRSILLGKEYDDLIELKNNTQNHHKHSEIIAGVVSEAISIRNQQDNSLANALAPTIEKSLTQSITDDPKPVADALYPVMGPAIRKSISEALNQMLETFNQMLEQSFSLKSLMWRFDAWRTGNSFSEIILLKTLIFQVEEVFLINREDGLLLQHVSLDSVITHDSDMVSGMLTAIQDFINDSFKVKDGEEADLDTLKLGDLTVFIEHGPKAVLAAVIRGKPPENIRILLSSTLEAIHHKYARELRDFKGDASTFNSCQPLLQHCLKVQKQQQKNSKLPLYILLGLLTLGAGYWSYTQYQDHQKTEQARIEQLAKEELERKQIQQVVDRLEKQPGIVVINSKKGKSDHEINLLLDPLAPQPAQLISELKTDKPIIFNTRPYLSIDDEILTLRAQQLLKPPAQINLQVENATLAVSGRAPISWVDELKSNWRQITGLKSLDSHALTTFDPNLAVINSLKRKIEQTSVSFENKVAELTPQNNSRIQIVTASINQLLNLSRQSKKSISISLSGHADATGKEELNKKLAQQRAQNVITKLIQQGVPAHIISNNTDAVTTQRNERSVHYEVLIQ